MKNCTIFFSQCDFFITFDDVGGLSLLIIRDTGKKIEDLYLRIYEYVSVLNDCFFSEMQN